MAQTLIVNPVIASIMSSRLLKHRNQYIWGNIRFPVISDISDSGSSWMYIPSNSDSTHTSLIGSPISGIAISGNKPFTLPGSYLSLSCYEFSLAHQKFTSVTTTSAPPPEITKITAGKSQKRGLSIPDYYFSTLN
jgi:hypothetical protein